MRGEWCRLSYFGLHGVRPVAGRDFVEADQPPTRARCCCWPTASSPSWGATLAIVGADFTMNDKVHTVIGILPPLPAAPDDNDVFMR